jgi:uncharacterized protein (TIGR03000 family)
VNDRDVHRGDRRSNGEGRGERGRGDWARRGDWGRGWGGWGWDNPWYARGWYNPRWYYGAYAYGDYGPGYNSYYEGPTVYPYSSYADEVPPTADSYAEERTPADQTMRSVDENAAMIAVRVPANAELWFNGHKTSQSGQVRQFETPSLDPAQEYTYEVRARWTENGHNVNRARRLSVHAGDRLGVNFIGSGSAGAAPSP